MKVKMKATMASPEGVANIGDIVDVADALGRGLLDGGYAELVEEAKAPKPELPPVEEAVMPEPETAVVKKKGK